MMMDPKSYHKFSLGNERGKKDFLLSSAGMEIICLEKQVFITAGWLTSFNQNILEKKTCDLVTCLHPPPKIYYGGGNPLLPTP